jgi:uncharacterized protein YceK
MKKSCLLMMIACAALSGCSSLTATKSAASPAPARHSNSASRQYHAQIISEYGDGETRFLNLSPDGDQLK